MEEPRPGERAELSGGSAKMQRLANNEGQATPAPAAPPAGAFPNVDEFDDCDSLFPPLAPVPGCPRFRTSMLSRAGPRQGWLSQSKSGGARVRRRGLPALGRRDLDKEGQMQ